MKKLLLSGLALSFGLAAVAQHTNTTSSVLQSRLNPAVQQKTAPIRKVTDDFAAPLQPIPLMVQERNSMTEIQIGTTTYDLQANYGSPGQRVYLWNDNTISAIWTFASTTNFTPPASPPERGTGYNYFNGTAWGTNPSLRLESFKTGFSSLAGSDALGEIVVNHGDNTSLGAPCTTSSNRISRPTKGTGPWSEVPASCASVLWWPRVAVGGAAGTTIIALGNSSNAGGGPINVSRSTDGGANWIDENIILPGFTAAFYEGPTDGYQVTTRGDVIAIAMGGFLESLVLWKSTDAGATWTETIVNQMPIAPYAYDAVGAISDVDSDGIADTILTTDSGIALAIDNNNMVHIAVGLTQVLDTDPGAGSVLTSYFPGTDGLVYWNESLPAGDITGNIIAFIDDIDGSGVIEIPDGLALYQCSLTGMPTLGVDASNNVHLIYSSIIENTTNGNSDPLLDEAFRNLYYMNSVDGGTNWSTPSRFEPSDFDEQVWPSMAAKVNNKVHVVYHKDGEPGNAYQPSESPAGTPVNDAIVVGGVMYNDLTNPVGLNENADAVKNAVVFPNPVQTVLNYDFTLTQSQKVAINLVDVLGQTVYTSALNGTPGVNNVKINVKSFTAGIYSLNTVVGGATYTEKVIIQ